MKILENGERIYFEPSSDWGLACA